MKKHTWFYSFIAPINEENKVIYGNGSVTTEKERVALLEYIIDLVTVTYPTATITSISRID